MTPEIAEALVNLTGENLTIRAVREAERDHEVAFRPAAAKPAPHNRVCVMQGLPNQFWGGRGSRRAAKPVSTHVLNQMRMPCRPRQHAARDAEIMPPRRAGVDDPALAHSRKRLQLDMINLD
jgi:hypothetical protein